MMKIDAMSAGALAFAAFAAWAYLKPKTPTATGNTSAMDLLKNQREQVGASLWQNADYLKGAGFSTEGISEWTLPGYFVPQLGS
jgi:hypothetical protein